MVKTNWNYTELATAYLKRPDYSEDAIDEMLGIMNIPCGSHVCDVGAGAAHLTIPLVRRGFIVDAVEPNEAMRKIGIERTQNISGVCWHEGTGEQTGLGEGRYALVTFGSSFNVTERRYALAETARILKGGGWFACMWNHRDLDDPVQAAIEQVIHARVPGYNYGTRREDQTSVIEASGLFGPVRKVEGQVLHRQTIDDCVQAWRSHATLARQARSAFHAIAEEIERMLRRLNADEIKIPYTTRIWIAQVKK